MQYRTFGNLNIEISALGFGAMHLPTKEDMAAIDEPLALEMMRYAFDNGVNYIDTAYPYHGGNSELVVGKALQDGYREKVYLATKMPTWLVNTAEDFDRFLNEQLAKLQVDHIDFYLLHGMQAQRWPKMRNLGVLEWGERAKADGRIGHLGFSFHDTYEVFREIVDAYDWPFCQIQYNYMNEDVQAGTKGLQYAAEKGLAVVIMEPLFGGCLVNPPTEVQQIWDRAEKTYNPVDMALQWLWNTPEVSLALSGMNTLEEVQQNIASACKSGVSTLSQEDLDIIIRVRDKYNEFNPIPCTKCRYCMPCPQGVDIPRNFELYNEAIVFKGHTMMLSRNLYNNDLPAEQQASACIACRECEEKCPQHIEISDWMPRVHEALVRK